MISMTAVSVFAYTNEEKLEILQNSEDAFQRGYDLLMQRDSEGDSIYTEKTIDAVEEAWYGVGVVINNNKDAQIEEWTDEAFTELKEKTDILNAACDAVVLKTTIKVTPTSKSFKAKDLKKKAKTFNLKAKVSSGAKASFKKSSGNSKISVTKAGKVTVKKGLKKGSYKVKVKVSVPKTTVNGTPAEAKTKTGTVTVKVK
jgi:HD superfamily phosphohydrolase